MPVNFTNSLVGNPRAKFSMNETNPATELQAELLVNDAIRGCPDGI
jgi:hypothetical protein